MATVLITGASGGIGKAFAEQFAKYKYDLVLVARNDEALQQVAHDLENRYKVKLNYFSVDLSLQNSAIQVYDLVKGLHINIDVLINNAGVGSSGEFCDMEAEKTIAMLNLNMITLTELTLLFAQDMKRNKRGKILNVSSTAAFQPAPYLAAYAASKSYVLSLTEALHIELGKYGISVSALCPGPTGTNWAEEAGMQSSKMFATGVMTAEQVALKGYKGLMRNKMTIVTGLRNKILSESARFFPRKWIATISGMMMK